MSGQIVDDGVVPAPKQHNTEDAKSAKEIWPDESNKARQKDTNAHLSATLWIACRAMAGR
ncbi:MAG: hypothetical protein AB8B85_08680 [Paracoccaceae bacterium]